MCLEQAREGSGCAEKGNDWSLYGKDVSDDKKTPRVGEPFGEGAQDTSEAAANSAQGEKKEG